MKLDIHSIHFTASDRLKDHVQKRCDKLDTFFDRITDGEVFLKLENDASKRNKLAEIKVNVPGNTLIASEQSTSFEESVDKCVDRLKVQLKKYKAKLSA